MDVLGADRDRRAGGAASTAAGSAVYGGQTTRSTAAEPGGARGPKRSRKSAASPTVLFIFQFAATSGLRRVVRHRAAPRPRAARSPSISSSEAPPPVESQSTSSASPNEASAAAESPPPTTVKPGRRGDRLGDRPGAGGERLELERAHRPVPEHRPGVADHAARTRRRCAGRRRGPSSRRAPRSRRARAPRCRRRRRAEDEVDRQPQVAVGSLGALEHPLARARSPSSSTSESPVG